MFGNHFTPPQKVAKIKKIAQYTSVLVIFWEEDDRESRKNRKNRKNKKTSLVIDSKDKKKKKKSKLWEGTKGKGI